MATLERLDIRVTLLEDRMTAAEKMRDELNSLTEAVRANTRLIEALRVTQAEHTQVLAAHGATLDKHTAILDKHTATLDRYGEKFVVIEGGIQQLIGMMDILIQRGDQ